MMNWTRYAISTLGAVAILLLASAPGMQAQLLVSKFYDNSVARYDLATGASLGDFVPAGSGGLNRPTSMTFGPDGNLYVSGGSSGVTRYDGKTGTFMDN